MTTKTKASAGVCPRLGRRLSLALSRGGAAGRGGRRRAAVPAGRWLIAVTRSPAPHLADQCG